MDFFPAMLKEEEIVPKFVTRREETETEEQLDIPYIPQDIVKKIQWEHKGQSHSLDLIIRRLLCEDFHAKDRVHYNKWAEEYVTGGICGEIRELANKLLSIRRPYGTYDEVEFILSFVQQAIKYQTEEGEYPGYPLESLVDGVGDCENFSILGTSILKLMGYEIALLFLPNHVALGVAGAEGILGKYIEYRDKRYYYCEMTAKGWEIGQFPDEYTNEKIDVFPISGVILKIDQIENA